jgi:hypothetical protein
MSEEQISDRINLSIIGCGSVCVSFLFQLFQERHSLKNIQVNIFCKDIHYATGCAYSTNNPDLLLNAENQEMSIDPDCENDFSNWLKTNNYTKKELIPRYIFGKYLQDRFEFLINKSSSKFKIELIQEEVIDCLFDEKQTVLSTRLRKTNTDIVVFCHGANQHEAFSELKNNPNFIDNFYEDKNKIFNIPDGSTILILGTGLAMVDSCLVLKKTEKNYHINTTSSTGYFPEIICHNQYPFQWHDYKNELNSYNDLINYINVNLSDQLSRKYNIFEEIHKYEEIIINNEYSVINDFTATTEAHITYLSALKIDIAIESVWKHLNNQDKLNVKHIEKYLSRFLSGIPEESFNHLKSFWINSKFKNYKLNSLKLYHEKFIATYLHTEASKIYDYVINCTGLDGIYRMNSPNLLARNIIRNNQLQINKKYGLNINIDTCNIYSRDSVNIIKNAFALGEAKIGSSHMCCDYSAHVRDVKKCIIAIKKLILTEIEPPWKDLSLNQ